jgi:arabinan endo-1,5-alpha-L-arabinosidase
MNPSNPDYQCYLDAITRQRAHQEDWLRTGYAPLGFYLKDFCLHEVAGVWHLYHIAGTPGVSCCLPGNEVWFGHATTRDFVTWETHAACFFIDIRGWDHGHVFAPFVLTHGGRHWMFYTGVATDNTQRIGVATSTDLFQWERAADRPVIRPEEYGWAFCPGSGGAACRDAHVIAHDGAFQMYYTAVTQDGRGCVARASSRDLLAWRDEGVAYAFAGWNQCESGNVQRVGDRWRLFFGGHHAWSYVDSDNPLRWPDVTPKKIRTDITGMEVIARRGDRWLVAYFGLRYYRLLVGVLDWSAAEPTIGQVTEPAALREFGL